MLPDEDIDLIVERLQSLRTALLDASSLIYAEQSGFLSHIAETLRPMTVPGVIEEVGHSLPKLLVVDPAKPDQAVDLQVVATAEREGAGLVSDDREVQARATAAGLETYNALEMLELTLLRGEVTLLEWDACRKRLLSVANYHKRIIHAGQQLHLAVRKRVG